LIAAVCDKGSVTAERSNREVFERCVDGTNVEIENFLACVHSSGPPELDERLGQVIAHPRSIATSRVVPHRPLQLDQRRGHTLAEHVVWARRTNGFGNPEPVAVGVGQVDFSRPGLLIDAHAKLGGHRIDVVDPDVHQAVRVRIASVYEEPAAQRCIAGQVGTSGRDRTPS
jgi:hypothetical protein